VDAPVPVGDESGTRPASRPWRWLPGPQGLVVLLAALAGARLGLRSVSDNSTLVHLRTGLEVLRTGHVPQHDPYSYTAPGHAWVVQSWLASLLYGLADQVGHHLLVVEQGAIFAAVGAVTALAARSSTAWRSGVAAILAICASAPGWSPRPLMFGLLCLGLTIVVVERRANPLWLLPVVWVWVNTHGTFPLGLAWLGARTLGEAIDVRGWPRVTLPRLGAFLGGLALAAVNPVGPKLLTFPLVALHKRSTFQGIVEWHSPNFQDPNTFIALVFVALSLVVLLRAPLPWAQLLPVAGFVVLALIAARNLGPLGVALAPALGAALSVPAVIGPGPGRWRAWVRAVTRFGALPVWRAAVVGVVVVAGTGLIAVSQRGPGLRLDGYPVAGVDHLAATGRLGPGHRIAAVDVVGCYLVWRVGPTTKVFIDDRYDMYPRQVVADASVLSGGRRDASYVLDHWAVDTVLWGANQALPAELLAMGGWRQDWTDGTWVVLVRDPGARPSGTPVV